MARHQVWVWGALDRAAGTEHQVVVSAPMLVLTAHPEMGRLRDMSIINNSIFALNHEGALFQWDQCDAKENACNPVQSLTFRKLGTPNTFRHLSRGGFGLFLIHHDGQVTLMTKDNVLQRLPTLGCHRFRSIACGKSFAIALDEEGRVFSWGSNAYGQLGLGYASEGIRIETPELTQLHDIGRIAAGWNHACASHGIDSTDLYVWGRNTDGRLGHGNTDTARSAKEGKMISVPWKCGLVSLACGVQHTVVVDEAGNLYGWGSNAYGQLSVTEQVDVMRPFCIRMATTTVIAAACGPFHTVIQCALGEVYSFGLNHTQQLGAGCIDDHHIYVPQPIHSLCDEAVEFLSCGESIAAAVTRHPLRYDLEMLKASTFISTLALGSSSSSDIRIHDETAVADYAFGLTPASYRPFGLPEKHPKEIKKHKSDVARQRGELERLLRGQQEERVAAQRSVLMEQARETSLERRRVVREEKIQEHISMWRSFFASSKSWRSFVSRRRVRKMIVEHGIPSTVRHRAWVDGIGNNMHISPELFETCGERALRARQLLQTKESTAELENKETCFKLIDMDVGRTFPDLVFYQKEGTMRHNLISVLQRYCFWRPDIGYVQGMSYIAGHLLLYLDPYLTFQCLCNLLNSNMLHDFLSLIPARMDPWVDVAIMTLDHYVPFLCKAMERHVLTDVYILPWFVTLFCRALPLNVIGRIWDVFVVFGDEFLLRCLVGIFLVFKSDIQHRPFEEIIPFISERVKSIQEEELFDSIPKHLPKKIHHRITQLAK